MAKARAALTAPAVRLVDQHRGPPPYVSRTIPRVPAARAHQRPALVEDVQVAAGIAAGAADLAPHVDDEPVEPRRLAGAIA
jgi:hypothetical protein